MTAAAPERRITIPPEVIHRVRLGVFSGLAQSLKVDHPSLEEFFKQAWPIIEPNTPLEETWFLGYIAEHLEAISLGQILRLAISVHPRSMKSNLVTCAWPTWEWIQKAWKRFMMVSYSQDLATEHSLKRRRIIESPWYREKWGALYSIMADQNRKNIFENTARGTMIATSSGGTATGRGANVIIFDDFINPKEAESEAERKQKIDDYSNTFSSRLNNPKEDAMIICAQRTHSQDLTGHVLKEGGWTHIELPVIAEKQTVYSFPISKKERIREVGEVLNPARQDASTIAQQRRASGSRTFSAQWMCNPTSDQGNMVKRFWWKFYKDDPRVLMGKMDVKSQSWDFAFKDCDDSSWVVGLVMGRLGPNKYIFEEVRDHLDFSRTCAAVIGTSSRWPMTTFKFYEDKANGPAVKSALADKVAGLIAVEPLGSKVARMSAVLPDLEAGNVFLPHPLDEHGQVRPERQWVIDFIEELARFPEEPNDRGDALSQGIVKLNKVMLYDSHQEDENEMIVDFGGNAQFAEIDLGGDGEGFNVGNL